MKEDSGLVAWTGGQVAAFLTSTHVTHAAGPGPHSEKGRLGNRSSVPLATVVSQTNAVRLFKLQFVEWLLCARCWRY